MVFSFILSPVAYGAKCCIRNLTFTLALPFSVAGAAYAESVTIFALGDSLTAGYGLPDGEGLVPQLNLWLAEQGADVTVLNGGVSGDTSAGGLSRLAWSLTPEVDAMIVTLGGNDLLRGLQPSVTRANIEGILTEAQVRQLPVLLIGMEAPGNFGPAYKEAFDQLYPELAAQYGAQHIGSYFGLIDPDATDPGQISEFMQADGIHPNAAGVKRAVESLGPQILTLVDHLD
ncbi:arylesterase [Tabrizicola sp. WMC-M-20]|nr:arylesterase [Tabrizicola sp. WMC-M-20]